jgi:ribosomal protein S4
MLKKNKKLNNNIVTKGKGKGNIAKNSVSLQLRDRLKTQAVNFKKFYRKRYKKQKRYSIIFKTLKIFNKFYEKNGDPEIRGKWRIRKPFFLMSFFFRRYIKRYYGRIRNKQLGNIYNKTKKKMPQKGYFFLRYFENIEGLLPIFLTRVGLFKNPMVAKVYIKTGKVFVNGKRIFNFNYILKPNDIIGVDSSIIKSLKYKSLYDNKIKMYAYFYRKWKIPRRYKYTWYIKSKSIKKFLFNFKKYDIIKSYLKDYSKFVKTQKGLINSNILKVFSNMLNEKMFLNFLIFLRYKRSMDSLKLKRKLTYRVKRFRFRKYGRFKRRTFRPYGKYMAAGFPYLFRLRVNRFMLNVEYSKRINKFIYIKPTIFENMNMYLFNTHSSLKERYPNTLHKDMFVFFLDNFKKSIL